MNARELLICQQLMQQYGDDIQQCISFAKSLYVGILRRWSLKRKRGIYHKPPEIVGRWPSRKLTQRERYKTGADAHPAVAGCGFGAFSEIVKICVPDEEIEAMRKFGEEMARSVMQKVEREMYGDPKPKGGQS